MARNRNTTGNAKDLKALLNNPQFREILASGGKIRGGDIPLSLRPSGIQEHQQINLSDVGRTQTQDILNQEASSAQVNKLADMKAALLSQRQVRGNAGQPLTAADVSGISQRFMSPDERLRSQIGGIVSNPTVPIGTAATSFQPAPITRTVPTTAIGQRVLTDPTRLGGGVSQKIGDAVRLGLLKAKQTALGGAVGGASEAAATAVNPSLTPSSQLPEDLIARSLSDLTKGATKTFKGTTLEDEAVKILKGIDPRFGSLSRKQRSEIAGFQFKNPKTNQMIRISQNGGFEVVS